MQFMCLVCAFALLCAKGIENTINISTIQDLKNYTNFSQTIYGLGKQTETTVVKLQMCE